MRHALKTVLFGFLGVRRREDHEREPLNPLHVIVAGVLLAALFVLVLATVAKTVTS